MSQAGSLGVVEWADLPKLDLSIVEPLCLWANDLEYIEPGEYDSWSGADFLKQLPTDWADHLKDLGLSEQDKVLDVGTGTGRLRLSLMKGGFRNVIGLDRSQACLSYQAGLQRDLGVMEIPGQLVSHVDDHADGSFASICLSSALHHIADLPGFFAWSARLLKPGGYFIASAEPTNMRKFNAVSLDDTRIDLDQMIAAKAAGERKRSRETTLLAEFHVGAGFEKGQISAHLENNGMELVSWDVYQWLSMVAYNYARNHIGTEAPVSEEFMQHYSNLLAFDDFIKRVAPDFAIQNFFSIIFVARKLG